MLNEQYSLGYVLVLAARNNYDLTSAVPAEYEADLWAAGDALMSAAALFGDVYAMEWQENETRRKAELSGGVQRVMGELSFGF